MLTDTKRDAAASVLERVCASVAQYDWNSLAPGLTVTASIGVAMVEQDDTIEQALERADGALYRAKSAGRNNVRVASSAAA